MARVAARLCGAERDPLDPAVDPVKAEYQSTRPGLLQSQPGDEIRGQPVDRERQIGGIGDRLGKAHPHPSGRGFAQWRQRLRQIAHRLVETPGHGVAKTARQRVARHRIKLADPLQPDPTQPLRRRRVETQRLDRQRGERRRAFLPAAI